MKLKICDCTSSAFPLHVFLNKKPVYKKTRTRYPQITPNLRNLKNGILT